MPTTNNGARINYGYLLLETSIKSLNIFKLINRSNILMLNALFIALLIPKELIRCSFLLVKITPNCVVSFEVRTTISYNSRLISVNFSCAISDHLFNSIGITILSVHLMDAKKTIIQLIINDLMAYFMAIWVVFTFALANAVAALCQLLYVFKLVSLKELDIAE